MAWHFEESESDFVSVADHAALSFPNSDWCLSMWVKFAAQAGVGIQFIISWRRWAETPSLNRYSFEPGNASYGKATFGMEDDDAVWLVHWSPGTTHGGTDWQHWLVYRNEAEGPPGRIHLYYDGVEDPVGGVAEVFTTGTNAGEPLLFGKQTDLGDYLDGDLAEAAFWNGWHPTVGQIAELAAGKCPGWYKPNLAWWIPMRDDYKENIAGLTITNNGTVLSAHPPQIIYPPGLARTIFLTGAV